MAIRNILLTTVICLTASSIRLPAQTLYVPGGSPGIGVSLTVGVGIGTSTPEAPIHVSGGPTMAAGWNRTAELQGTFPVLAFQSNASRFAGIGYDFDGGMRFWVNGTTNDIPGTGSTVMTLLNDGRVGIGAVTPRSRLDIGTAVGAGKGARFGDYLEINEREAINNASSIGWNAYIAADDGTYAPSWSNGSGMVLAMSGGGVADLDFWGTSWNGDSTPRALGGFSHVLHLSTNGNVGIGTTSPLAKLQINSGAGPAIIAKKNASFTGALYFDFQDTSGTELAFLGYGSPGSDTFHVFNAVPNAGLSFGAGARERMLIDASGNVGIGTSSPTHKLSVNGAVRAKEVIVDTGWSDYVFKPGYRLAPLSEVATHIREHGTLPGVPSEAEVAREGVSVGEMQAKLLAKIEELTLHQISQAAQLEVQARKIEALEKENADLRRNMPTRHE